MTIRVCDRCGIQMKYTDGYILRICFDTETVLEKDVCKNCRKSFTADMYAFFEKKEEKHVGN